jgi:hypothetical protein
MRKPVVPRMLGLLVLYCAVFIALVMIQFSKKGNFTHRAGNMAISGHYGVSADQESPNPNTGEYTLASGATVSFGGLEFTLKNRNDLFNDEGLILLDLDGGRRSVAPERLILSGDTARFRLPEGTEIVFSSLYSGGGPELRISAVFDDGLTGVEIPFKPQRSSVVRNVENGQLSVAYEGSYYHFSGPVHGEKNGRLLLDSGISTVSYRARPQRQFNPGDFAIAPAQTVAAFDAALAQWRDLRFSQWKLTASSHNDEDTVIAYTGESIPRGNYRAALASVPSAFRSGSQRSYRSSVYIGGMTQAFRSFTTAERDRISLVTRLIRERSPELLAESHVFAFLSVRRLTSQMNNGLEYIRSIDPDSLTLDMCPGIFEGYTDIRQWRPEAENPFERLIERSLELIAESIQKDVGRDLVFVFSKGSAGSEFNLRLGKALRIWAENAGGGDGWAALGRSLVLSVLSLVDSTGDAPPALIQSGSGEISEDSGGRISAARLYRILNPGNHYPRAALIGSGASGLWAWTASPSLSAVRNSETLDIQVSFPVNETHYMIVQGVPPFAKLQLYNIDFRSDPQFERYDSSGWVYYPQEQTLILKMKHRERLEHIRISFRAGDEPKETIEAVPGPLEPAASASASVPASVPADVAEVQTLAP